MEFRRHTLPNGLELVGIPMPRFSTASIGLWVRSGSIYEAQSQNGISHFIEHMLFKGTYRRSARQIAEEMDAVGGMLNAYTDTEWTCFDTEVVDEHVPLALEMLADLILNSRLDESDIEREKNVVLEEIGMSEDTPDDLAFELLHQAYYGLQRVSQPILGTAANVRSFTRETLLAYMDKRYRPDKCVLSIAGHFVWEALVRQCEELFGKWKSSEIAEETIPLEAHTPGLILREKDTEQLHICIGFPGPVRGSDAFYPFDILNTVLGDSMSSRLFQTIREERGLAYSTYSDIQSTGISGLLCIYAGTSRSNANKVIELINLELAKLARDGISRDEFERAKKQTVSTLIMNMESTGARMKSAGRYMLIDGKPLSKHALIHRFEAVDPDEVNRLARHAFTSPAGAAVVGSGTDIIDKTSILNGAK